MRGGASDACTTPLIPLLLHLGHRSARLSGRFARKWQPRARCATSNRNQLLRAICSVGTISTLGASGNAAGYPTGSVVQYAADEQGRPIFAFSSLSGHTRDLRTDPRCSLTVSSPTFRVGCPRQLPGITGSEPSRESPIESACESMLAKLHLHKPCFSQCATHDRCRCHQSSGHPASMLSAVRCRRMPAVRTRSPSRTRLLAEA